MSARKATRQPKAQTVIARNKEIRAAHAELAFQPVPDGRTHYLPIAGAEALKPCPFCAEFAFIALVLQDSGNFWAQAQCSGCGIHGPEADAGSEGDDDTIHGLIVEAARMWNARDRKWGAA